MKLSDREDFRYWAFISYTHADAKWGDWLHAALETYRVPSRLYRLDEQVGCSQRIWTFAAGPTFGKLGT